MPHLPFEAGFEARAVSPFREMGAYEALWSDPHTTFRSLSKRFAEHPGSVPSDFVPPVDAEECATFVQQRFAAAQISHFGVRVHGAGEYPEKLRDATHPIEFLYYQGWWDLVASRSVAVVGTRNPSPDGLARTRRLTRELVSDDFTVVSGLAAGIDRAAHDTAIEHQGRTISPSSGRPCRASIPIEILSWAHSCNQRMRQWTHEHGVFVPLDDFYDAITFMEPSRPGHEFAPERRRSAELDLSRRPMV